MLPTMNTKNSTICEHKKTCNTHCKKCNLHCKKNAQSTLQKMQVTLQKKSAISLAKKILQVVLQKICKLYCGYAGYVAGVARDLAKGPDTHTIFHNAPLFTTNNPQYHDSIKGPFINTIAYPTNTTYSVHCV